MFSIFSMLLSFYFAVLHTTYTSCITGITGTTGNTCSFCSPSSLPPFHHQLPIVLQVLLSQVHRQRALLLLARFLDLGSWAVNQALTVGIFPYVLKLLQSPAVELRDVLVFIWIKILALDPQVSVFSVAVCVHFFLLLLLSNFSHI